MDTKSLIKKAIEARQNAYVPYSHYAVGAALVTDSGKVFSGCNIENAAYSPSNCAERTAIFKAVSEGERKVEKVAIVAGADSLTAPLPAFAAPCGVCRQVLAEFCSQDAKIILAKSEDEFVEYSLSELLPFSFTSKDL